MNLCSPPQIPRDRRLVKGDHRANEYSTRHERKRLQGIAPSLKISFLIPPDRSNTRTIKSSLTDAPPYHSGIRRGECQTHVAGGKGRCDIMHYHLSAFGQYTGTWKNAEVAYRKILRDPEKVNFITVMREPRSHLLSYYYYFIQPSTKVFGDGCTQF